MRVSAKKDMTLRALLVVLAVTVGGAQGADFSGSWRNVADRVWVGPEYWANRLQDWRVSNGRLECVEGRASKPMRAVHLLTHTLAERPGAFDLTVRTGLIKEEGTAVPQSAATGFLIGAGGGLDCRAAALIHHSWGPNAGLFAGIDANGFLFVQDFSSSDAKGGRGAGPKTLVRQERSSGRCSRSHRRTERS